MSYNKPIRRIAIVGTGVIGASWAAQYLARGFDVVATDPAPNAEANLRKYVDEAWGQLEAIGLSPGAARDRLTFTPDMKAALAQADLVQENAPERPEFKMKLFADMEATLPVDSIIASSSSGITPSVMQSKCKHPERVLVGHPFNPPHIVPLVEVVGGAKTAPEAIQQAMAFYASIGKKPIQLRKELPGHVANRLQAALYREMLYLIEQGVLSVDDMDVAVSYGPGLPGRSAPYFTLMKARGERIVMLTAYDATMARLLDRAGRARSRAEGDSGSDAATTTTGVSDRSTLSKNSASYSRALPPGPL